MNKRLAIAALITILPMTSFTRAQTWSQWRGPQFNGSAEATGLPTTWTTDENVVWKTTLPGASAATPVVGGGRIFVTAMDDESGALLAIALDRATGKILWKHAHGEGAVARRRGFENTRAECSAVTDGTHAWFLFGNGILVGYDLDGKEFWKRDLVAEYGEFQIGWGYASSPLLIDGVLVVQCLRTGPSFLLGVDPATGKNLWKHTRQDDAFAESVEAYTSPLPFVHEGTTSIIVLGADCLTAHDPKTGAERWRWSGLNPNGRPNFRAVTNALVGPDGFIYVTTPQGNPLHALQVTGTTVEEKWTMRRATPDVTTPLLYRDRLYVLDGKRRRKLTCLDPRTGVEHWQGEIEGDAHIRSSPTAADGKIFIMDADGVVTVLAAGDAFNVLARNELGSYPSRANVAIEGGQLLIRTADTLYCVGETASN